MALFFNAALMQEHDVVGDVARKTHLVGHHDHGPAFLGQEPQLKAKIDDEEEVRDLFDLAARGPKT